MSSIPGQNQAGKPARAGADFEFEFKQQQFLAANHGVASSREKLTMKGPARQRRYSAVDGHPRISKNDGVDGPRRVQI